MEEVYKKSVELHEEMQGKIEMVNKIAVDSKEKLSLVYSPGVAQPCLEIEKNPERAYDLTIKGNTIAVVTNGTAVLGLGDIGPLASLPVMEGKAMLFKKFAGINAVPICIDSKNTRHIIETIRRISPAFGGINLEDIAAPESFEIEEKLQDIGIPVFHDDQHGTAIVTLAALINACKVTNKKLTELKVVINGAGAAGIAIAKLLRCFHIDSPLCQSVKTLIVCDSQGAIHRFRNDLNKAKTELLKYSNFNDVEGDIHEVIKGADVFIGVSKGNILTKEDIQHMAENPIIFAMANPTPEIMPKDAYEAGAAIVGTGRSDFPNQINNVLAFPGIFKGALKARASTISTEMKLAAAYAIANSLENPTAEMVIPSALDSSLAQVVADAVEKAAHSEKELERQIAEAEAQFGEDQ
ncbi:MULTISPECIES: NADP-dependent malic enzyme [Roseivirga]|uniref:NAD(P)-dependent malic enzyme n=1 Tax=Roseivirga TaxID=290180 RepID=UPI00257B9A0E|nr:MULTISPECIES: NADP-dependent malic enzyme [Roseivirga]MEC7754955.1 NADP-dependent malic enzyme [Bacteroidota bacterium]|tara:strand:- start:23751 stop:24980 length:1230 start_codon:yes stop_codon:yes gene_type:complete